MPFYNVRECVGYCMGSLLAQTFKEPYEIICVDDGSTDTSLNILDEYASKDDRFVILRQDNKGAGAARNAGLALATGKYLSFLDADDFFEKDMLELAYKKAEEDKSDFVVFQSNQYYTANNTYKETPWTLRIKEIPPYSPFTQRQMTDNVFKVFVGWAWDKLYNREFVLNNHLSFQEQRTSNDLLFVFSAVVLAKKISVVEKVLAHQRRDAKDSLSKTRENSWFCFHDALKALKQRLIDENLYGELEKDFINYCVHSCLWNIDTLAEPTRTTLINKLKKEWSQELGIKGKPNNYFYNKREFLRYKALIG